MPDWLAYLLWGIIVVFLLVWLLAFIGAIYD
jgi:hypothetical protein